MNRLGLGLRTLVSSGAVVSLPEVTEVGATADSNWSLHNKYFTLYDAAGSVGVRMNGGALKEKSQVDFTGLTGMDFATGADGKYFVAPNASIGDAIWFNTGGEVAPSTGGNEIEVVINTGYDASQIAAAALAALVGDATWQDAGTSGAVLIFENVVTGPQVNASAGDSGATVSTLVEGRNAAGAVGGADRTVVVDFAQNDSANTIAGLLIAAFSGDAGFTVTSTGGNGVSFTDLANGARTDAADGDTGFSISTTQQGV